MKTPARKPAGVEPAEPVRFRVFADLHLNEWKPYATTLSNGINSRLAAQLDAVRQLATSQGNGPVPRVCIFAGDLVHGQDNRHGVMTPMVAWAVEQVLATLSAHFEFTVLIPGNHDYQVRDSGEGRQWLHALAAFKGYAGRLGNVLIVDKPEVLDLSHYLERVPRSTALACLPWQSNPAALCHAVKALAAQAASFDHKVLAAHTAVREGVMGTHDHRPSQPIGVNDLLPDFWDAVALGDYHKPQRLAGNVAYAGSTLEHNWGEAGEPWKGALDLSLEPGSARFSPLVLDTPRFHLWPVDTPKGLKLAQEAKSKGHFVRVQLAPGAKVKEAAVREAGLEVLAPPEFRDVVPALSGVSLRSTVEEVLEAYLAAFPPEDAEGLLELGREIIQATEKAPTFAQVDRSVQVLGVKAQNFLNYPSLAFRLDGLGVVLVDGAVGAGKSSLVEALAFGLYGRTLRGLPVSKVKRRKAATKDPFMVQVAFRATGQLVTVTRAKNHPTEPEGLSINVDGQPVTRGGDPRQEQKRLDDLLGYTFDQFCQSVLFGQASGQFFSQGTDAQQKAHLEDLMGGNRFAPYHETAKAKRQEALTYLHDRKRDLDTANRDLERAQASLADLRQREEGWKAAQANRAQLARQEEAQAKAALDQAWDAHQVALKAYEDLAPLQEAQDGLTVPEAQRNLQKAQEAEREAREAYQDAKRDLAALDTDLARYGHLHLGPCPTCSQEVTEEHRAQIVADLRGRRPALQATLADTEKALARAQEDTAREASVLDAAQDREEAARRRAWKREQKAQEVTNWAAAVRAAQDRVRRATDATATAQEANPYQEVIQREEEALEAAQLGASEAQEATSFLQAVHDQLDQLVRLFGNQGLKAYLFQSILPDVNREANAALAILSDNTQAVTVDLKGDKLAMEVVNVDGADDYRGDSGGEKTQVDLALAWGLHRLTRGRVNVLVFDEVGGYLDATNQGRLAELLHRFTPDQGTVLVMSHREELKGRIATAWRVTKPAGESILEGAEPWAP